MTSRTARHSSLVTRHCFQDFVHRARAVAVQVERDVAEAERAEASREFVGDFALQSFVEFRGRDLKPDEFVVMSDAKLSETEFAHDLFTAINRAQPLDCDGRAVGEARREAG